MGRRAIGMAIASVLALSGCSTVSDWIGGKGEEGIVDLHDGTFEITAAGGLTVDRAKIRDRWNALASEACKGRPYTVIKSDWGAMNHDILVGTIRCK